MDKKKNHLSLAGIKPMFLNFPAHCIILILNTLDPKIWRSDNRASWYILITKPNYYYYLLLLLLLLLLFLLLLRTKRYNLYKVLACSTTFFQLSLFCATFFQLFMFMLFISSKTSSSQRVLGLPIGLLHMGFHLLIFCTMLSSAVRSTWPNQFSLCFLINPIISCPFNISFIS